VTGVTIPGLGYGAVVTGRPIHGVHGPELLVPVWCRFSRANGRTQ